MLSGARLEAAVYAGAWSLHLAGAQVRGTLDYQGQVQFGLPLTTTTQLRHAAWLTSVRWQGFEEHFQLAAGFGGRDIDRRIQPTAPTPLLPFGTQGLNERLQSNEWHLSGRAQIPVGSYTRLSWESARVRSYRARLKVDFLGTFDATELAVPGWFSTTHCAAWDWLVSAHLRLGMRYEWHRYAPPASDLKTLTSDGMNAGVAVRYPGSEQRTRTWGLQLQGVF